MSTELHEDSDVAGPLGAGQTVPAYTAIEQALLRYAGVRWQMPEYLISGDASNSNFASALIAESLFVKGRESEGLRKKRFQSGDDRMG